jgi:hypothetical protein
MRGQRGERTDKKGRRRAGENGEEKANPTRGRRLTVFRNDNF